MSSINSVNAGNTDNTKFGKLDPINAQIEALANSIPKQAHSKEDLENGLEVKNKIIELKKQLIAQAQKNEDNEAVEQLNQEIEILKQEKANIQKDLNNAIQPFSSGQKSNEKALKENSMFYKS